MAYVATLTFIKCIFDGDEDARFVELSDREFLQISKELGLE